MEDTLLKTQITNPLTSFKMLEFSFRIGWILGIQNLMWQIVQSAFSLLVFNVKFPPISKMK